MIAERFNIGDFGEISFARGSHMQDMEGWPDYWMGLPPHHYMTHAIAASTARPAQQFPELNRRHSKGAIRVGGQNPAFAARWQIGRQSPEWRFA